MVKLLLDTLVLQKNTSVDSSSCGYEFVAMKQCCEYLRGLRYKLMMIVFPCDGPYYIEGDHQYFLDNKTVPNYTLNKKNQIISCHFTREGSDNNEWRTTSVNTHANEEDPITNKLPSGDKRKVFVRNLLHHVFRIHEATT